MTADPKFLAAYKQATHQQVEKRDITNELQKGDPGFLKEMETFLRSLGIGYAGGIPSSLLARQDLETTKLAKSQAKKDSVAKAGDMMYCVRTNGTEYFRTPVKAEAEEMLGVLTSQGQFAVLIQEKIMGAEKGQVETTGKQLDHAVVAAEKAEDTEEKDDLATRIKTIQLKRQKATIAERSKEVGKGGKKFKDVWGALKGPNKN